MGHVTKSTAIFLQNSLVNEGSPERFDQTNLMAWFHALVLASFSICHLLKFCYNLILVKKNVRYL